MAQEYVLWGDKKGIPFMTLNRGKFKCILRSIPSNFLLEHICTVNKNLTSVSFPKLTTILGSYALRYAFYDCTNLTSVSFPKLTTISGSYALGYVFYSCSKLTSVSFPKVTTISGSYALNYAFSDCTNLTSVSFPEVTTISGSYALSYAFSDCTNLTSVSFPKLTTVSYPNNAFWQAGSSSLTIHLPKALSSLGITNNNGSNSSSYCSFVYDL